ncbi:MAG: sel1 repeat family protein [Planctomycetaceae bacterium]|jgi:hypothetical protein|nr:sel1 repeat family protein [Planctomycetaceae bacterium]
MKNVRVITFCAALTFCFASVACFGQDKAKFDDDTSLVVLKKAANEGDAEAQWRLGRCYANGAGVSRSMSTAAKWFRKSAAQGNDEAQWRLGVCYFNGNGVTKDEDTALLWFQKSAKQGNARGDSLVRYMAELKIMKSMPSADPMPYNGGFGVPVPDKTPKPKKCSSCGGTRKVDVGANLFQECRNCGGTGIVME